MHSVWTFLTPFIGAICNCNVESGCMAMKLTVGYSMPIMWRGESVAQMDAEACISCRQCVDVCPFGALSVQGSNGDRRVSLEMDVKGEQKPLRVRAEVAQRVRPSEQLVEEVEQLCGAGSVELR